MRTYAGFGENVDDLESRQTVAAAATKPAFAGYLVSGQR